MDIALASAVVALCAIALILAILIQEHKRERRLKLLVRKLYSTQLFDELLPLLRIAKRHPLEQISVDKRGVRIRLMEQTGHEISFDVVERGYGFLSRERQEAMRVLLEQCLPKLADHKLYHTMMKRECLINGDIEYTYSYTMKTAYKNKLARAPYYDGSLKARLW